MAIIRINIVGVLALFIAGLARADAGLPDPTRPADFSTVSSIQQVMPKPRAEFNLNAIRISAVDRSAMINGRLVRVGDDVGTAKVIAINTVDVVLDYERKLITVPLYAQGISKQFLNPEIKK